MKPVTVYTKPLCPYCVRAISLLKRKGVAINEISAAEQRKQILLELKAVGARVDKLQKALEAGVKVKVISMPEAKKEGA